MNNNNKKTITICSIAALAILAIVILVTLINGMPDFSIIFSAFFVGLLICLAIYLREKPDEFNIYVREKKKILRTYDSVIIEVENIPNIAGKNIIKVKSIEDLVDAQLELREPIYYKNDNDSCFFILLHFNEACIFVLRMNDSVVSPTEQSIRYMKEDKTDKTKEQESILENLEKTVVYKLDELRSFRISPIRNNEKISVVDDTAIKKEIESSKEQEITSNALSNELSKTMYLKDLRERMLKYEEEQMSKTKEIATAQNALEKELENKALDVDTSTEKEEEDTKNEELSSIEKLRKMVKEQEQELTKELVLNDKTILEEDEAIEEISKEEEDAVARLRRMASNVPKESTEEQKIDKSLVEEVRARVEEKSEEETIAKDEIKLEIVDSTAKSHFAKDDYDEELSSKKVHVVSLDDEHDVQDSNDDDFVTGVVVLDSLEEKVEEQSMLDDNRGFVPVTLSDEEDDDDDIEIVNRFEPVTLGTDEEDEEDSEIEEPISLSEEDDETAVEEEKEEEIEDADTNIEIEEDDDLDFEDDKKDVSEEVKPRRNTKPRKVTHSARRAQKHVNRVKR